MGVELLFPPCVKCVDCILKPFITTSPHNAINLY